MNENPLGLSKETTTKITTWASLIAGIASVLTVTMPQIAIPLATVSAVAQFAQGFFTSGTGARTEEIKAVSAGVVVDVATAASVERKSDKGSAIEIARTAATLLAALKK